MRDALHNRTIAIPESRQLQALSSLLEKRGARVLPVPMVGILDAPDPEPVLAWINGFIARPPDLFIIMTGEGVRRLLELAQRHGLRERFVEVLGRVRKICRGPKPVNTLREAGMGCDIRARAPTTEGVIATLETLDVEGGRIAVQLYGQDPNRPLMDYLESRHVLIETVAPYVYADRSTEDKVVELIRLLDAGDVDVIAFTSKPQFKRLQQVANKSGLEKELADGLGRTAVAAVGPVVRDQLLAAGVDVAIMPERTYFMKPMVTAIARHLDREQQSRNEKP